MENWKYFKDFIFHNWKKLSILLSLYILLQIIIGGAIITAYTNYIDKQISYNVIKYQNIDYEQLCDISECKVIKTENGSIFIKDRKSGLDEIINNKYIIRNLNGVYIDTNLNFSVKNQHTNAVFTLNTDDVEHLLIDSAFVITPVLMLFTVIFLWISIKEERESSLRALAGNEALLTNKSMILITENIHHELNTPMEVIDNKINKIQKLLLDYLNNEYNDCCVNAESGKLEECVGDMIRERRKFNSKLTTIEEDFEYIKQSSEQIYSILERMRGFKHLRYSNGNKSVYNIISGAFKVISISNSNFTTNIDENLKNYVIKSDHFKNADLLNNMINHIKNSLDANANKIHVIFNGEKNGYIKIRIVDNGNGITMKNKDNIFEPNFSTKTIGENGVRGNGLYLNRSILKSVGGNVVLIDTSKYGTTFEITIPAKHNTWKMEELN